MVARLIADADRFEKLAADILAAMKPVRPSWKSMTRSWTRALRSKMAQMREAPGAPDRLAAVCPDCASLERA